MSSSAHPADGDLPPAQRLAVEQHTSACAACLARLSALESASRETAALLGLLPTAAPDLRIERIVSRARAPRLRWGVIAAGLAHAVATIAGATVGRPYVRALVAEIRAVIHPAAPAPSPPAANGHQLRRRPIVRRRARLARRYGQAGDRSQCVRDVSRPSGRRDRS